MYKPLWIQTESSVYYHIAETECKPCAKARIPSLFCSCEKIMCRTNSCSCKKAGMNT